MKSSAVLLLLAAAAASAKIKPVTSYFNVCKRSLSSEQLANCVKNTLEKARPRLIKGIPELGLFPLEPLHVDKIDMKENSGRLRMSQTLSNLTIYGMGDFVIKNVSIDKSTFSTNITIWIKKLRFESAYEIDGQILVLPVKGSGHASYNFTDVTATSYVTLKTFRKGNKSFFKIESYKMSIEPQGFRSHFTNLFNGDKRLGDATNAFLNENWREAYSAYRHLSEGAFAKVQESLADKVYSQYSVDELFPE